MSNLNEQYRSGVRKLLDSLGQEHKDYRETLGNQAKLEGIIDDEQRHGPTDTTRAAKSRVIEELNRMCIANLKKTFNDLSDIDKLGDPSGVTINNHSGFLSGAVLYANVTGFSALSPNNQDAVMSFMKQELEDLLTAGPNCWLDFRDGEFVLFLERARHESQQNTLAKVFLFGLQLQLQNRHRSFRLGMTIHWDENAKWYHIKDKSHLVGHALGEAQLLMSFSDGEHFFVSANAFDSLRTELGRGGQISFGALLDTMLAYTDTGFRDMWLTHHRSETYGSYKYECRVFTFHDRHKQQHTLYNFHASDPDEKIHLGSASIPYHQVALEYRDEPVMNPHQAFIQRLIEADKVSIIALTHEATSKFLQKALELRAQQQRGFWDNLQIVFPSQSVLEKVIDQHPTSNVRIAKWEGGKRSVFQFLLGQGSNCLDHWECLEFDGNLPFVGNWFISPQNVSIRVAPILPGFDMKQTYYMEVFEGMPAYRQLAQSFSVICSQSSRIIEWDIYGQLQEENLYFQGVVSRKRRDDFGRRRQGQCFPVVLIMLHGDVSDGHKSILQQRTKYNSSSDFDTFSNISGRVTDVDVYLAKELAPHLDFQDLADVIATSQFMSRTGLRKGDLLPPDTWKAAAAREIQEEIGLRITPDRLRYHRTHHLKRDDGDLLFKIFSLELKRDASVDEWQLIRDVRPYAELSAFDLSELRQHYNDKNFNKLLQREFENIFLPIFQELGIE